MLPLGGACASGVIDGMSRVSQSGPRPRGPAQRRASAAHLAEQNGVGRPIGDVVVTDSAVQVKDARVVRRDRRLDVVMAAGITGQGGRSALKPSEGQRSVWILESRAVSLLGA